MKDCSMTMVKYAMFIFNFVFWLSGFALIIIGAAIRSEYAEFFSYADNKFATADILIISTGVIVFVIGFMGCCGAIKENYCMMTFFAVLLSTVFILEITAGALGYYYRGRVAKAANRAFDMAIQNYNTQRGAEMLLDWAQRTWKCCGKSGPDDYTIKEGSRVYSLCGKPGEGIPTCHKGGECDGELYKDGCKKEVIKYAENHLLVIGSVAVGVAFVEIVGIALACCLMKAIKWEYEPV